MKIEPLHPLFAAEISGVRLEELPVEAFHAAMDRYAVCVIRSERPPTNDEHLAFSRRLGPLQQMKMLTMLGKAKSRLPSLELVDVGNLDENGAILPDDDRRRLYNKGNLLWQGRALLAELTAHATQPQFVYRHPWRLGDLVGWDNLATMHRGTPFDDTRHPRDMRRTTVLEMSC